MRNIGFGCQAYSWSTLRQWAQIIPGWVCVSLPITNFKQPAQKAFTNDHEVDFDPESFGILPVANEKYWSILRPYIETTHWGHPAFSRRQAPDTPLYTA